MYPAPASGAPPGARPVPAARGPQTPVVVFVTTGLMNAAGPLTGSFSAAAGLLIHVL